MVKSAGVHEAGKSEEDLASRGKRKGKDVEAGNNMEGVRATQHGPNIKLLYPEGYERRLCSHVMLRKVDVSL